MIVSNCVMRKIIENKKVRECCRPKLLYSILVQFFTTQLYSLMHKNCVLHLDENKGTDDLYIPTYHIIHYLLNHKKIKKILDNSMMQTNSITIRIPHAA